MYSFERNLEKYAEVAVNVGVNLKEGQGVLLRANTESLDIARLIVKKAYEAGAKHVQVLLSDDQMSLLRYQYGSKQVFNEFPNWIKVGHEAMVEEDYTLINVIAPNPELLKEINPELVAQDSKTASIAMERFMKATVTGELKWNIIAVPSKAWAKAVFPEKTEEDGINALWEQIFNIARINTENPVDAWKKHDEMLKFYSKYLNEKRFVKFNYKAPGTDLEVFMADEHVWIGGSTNDINGNPFMPNVPTEEIFSMPSKLKVNGTLKSTKPLNVRGQLIDGFGFTFKDGKVVDFYAEKGEKVLQSLLDTDEGARYLGEIALVPDDSPISNSGLIFSNTLFDENASCHFALGRAYAYNVKGGEHMEKEELAKRGANHSLIHVDFMVGSKNLEIIGETQDGEKITIFKEGNWAI